MEEKKNYEVIYYMKNGFDFKIKFLNTTKKEIIQNMNNSSKNNCENTFFGNENETQYVNLNEVNCFEINELAEMIESENK